ncbi:MAG: response regulator, partial [Rhodospirillaceae bacterium]|nr:response regulator [Rhodospirillaceae bacterium]
MTDIDDGPAIEIYLGEEQLEIRRMLRSALRAIQLDILEDFETCEPLREAVEEGLPDLIIVDSDLAGGDACRLIRDIRNNELGKNPFVPVIVTTWRNTKERIRELIDIGADGLLIKPISNNAIQSHVNFIVNERKPFVVTSSYIGPDRRKDPKHTSDVPLIEVPNTLKAKIDGEPIDSSALRRQIASNTKQVNVERLRRNAFELSFLVELALAG